MASTRTKKTTTGRTPSARRAPKRNDPRRRRQAARTNAPKTPPRAEKLPSWSDLSKANERSPGRPRTGGFIERVSTGRFALLLLAVVVAGTLYVGNVHATREALAEAQRARRDNLNLHLKLNRLRGDFDRATGPAVVYRRARALGLVEGIDYGPTIREE
ncbi:MAG: hypothetical protein R3247_15535 [Rhodothermales bacterium]|nr:hypothetical protein [Rhodothermales bacterium]